MMAAGKIELSELALSAKPRPPRGSLRGVVRTLSREPSALLGLFVLAGFCAVAALAPLLAPFPGPVANDVMAPRHASPFWMSGSDPRYWLGTDMYGRDVLSLLIYGTRLTLFVGGCGVLLLMIVGTALGLLAAWLRGGWDNAIMRLADVTEAVPSFLAYALVALMLVPTPLALPLHGVLMMPVVLSTVGWAQTVRLVRGRAIAVVEEDFVLAARSVGVPTWRLLWRHVLPNSVSTVLVTASYQLPVVIVAEGFLSEVQIGIRPPALSLAGLVFQEWQQTVVGPVFVLLPTLGIVLIALAATAVGNGLQRALDPRETF